MFSGGNGLHLLEIVDHFIANFGLVMIGLVECLILGWMYTLYKLRDHANETSEIKLGRWWDALIKFVVPTILFILLIVSIVQNIANPYMGYPWWLIVGAGVTPLIILFALSFVFMKIRAKEVIA